MKEFVTLVSIFATSSGTDPFTLGGAVDGYRGYEALTDGNTYSYSVQEGDSWEYGEGTYIASSHTLTRTVALSVNGAGVPVDLPVGVQVCFTVLAEDFPGTSVEVGQAVSDAQAAAEVSTAQAAYATTEAQIASAAAITATTQAAVAGSAAASTSAAAAARRVLIVPASSMPYEVTQITGGIGTGSGGVPGEYAMGYASGTGPNGHEAFVTIGSDGKVASYRNANPGLSLTNGAPTYSFANVPGLTGATLPSGVVTGIPTGTNFWAPSVDGSVLNLYTNNGSSGTPVLISGVSIPLKNLFGFAKVFPFSGTIIINRAVNVITTSSSATPCYLLTNGNGTVTLAASQSVALPTSSGSLYVYVTAASGVIGVANNAAIPVGTYLLAVVTPVGSAEGCFADSPGTNLQYVNAAGVNLPVSWSGVVPVNYGVDLPTLVGGSANIGINLQTGVVTTNASMNCYIVHTLGFKQLTANQNVAITGFTNGTFLHTIYVNMATGAIGAVQNNAGSVPAGCLAVAYVNNQVVYPAASFAASGWPFSLTNTAGAAVPSSPVATLPKPYALILNIDVLNITMTATNTGSVTTNGVVYAMTPDGLVQMAAGQSVAFTLTGASTVYCSTAGVLGVAINTAPPAGSYPLIGVKLAPASGADCTALAFGQNVTFTDTTGNTSVIGAQTGLKTFNNLNTRLILPDDLFFISGHPQPLFRNSYLCEDDATLASSVTLLFDTGADTDSPILGLGHVTAIDPSVLGPTATFSMFYPTNVPQLTQPLTVHTAPAAGLVSAAPKIMCIGDSLTMFGMIRAYQDQLTALGANPTFVGTYDSYSAGAYNNPSSAGGNLMGEGRGGWSYRSFTGRDSSAAGNALSYPVTGSTTTQYQNPFLRVATSADLSNNPGACYAFTANTYKNPSYTENPGLGTYYIFDFANYLANTSTSHPDVITIALGDNDILWGGAQYTLAQQISEAQNALSIMVKSIRAALPTVKIVIVPLRARGIVAGHLTDWSTKYCPLIEAIQTSVRALKTGGVTGLYMVGTYAHTCRTYGFPIASNTPLSAVNQEQVGTLGDYIHWSSNSNQPWPKKRVARTEVAAIACALAGV